MMMRSTVLTIAAGLVSQSQAFVAKGAFGVASRVTETSSSSSCLHAVGEFESVAGKYFQLEEMEDKDTATTEIYLQDDGSIAMGDTDGPEPLSSGGTWYQPSGTNDFEMTLFRHFEGGQGEEEQTDMGNFKYMVERSFEGELSLVGSSAAVTGVIHELDSTFGDRSVGYFNMIDTTEEREQEAGGFINGVKADSN